MLPKLPIYTLPFLILAVAFCKTCNAQNEDSLKISFPQNINVEKLPLPSTHNTPVYPKLGVDQLEFSEGKEKKTIENLSIECYMEYYKKQYRIWEKEEYGKNMHLHKFVYDKTRKKSTSPFFTELPKSITSGISGLFDMPSKKELWFWKRYKYDDRGNFGLDMYIDTLNLRKKHNDQIKRMVDSVLLVKKLKRVNY